MKLCVVEVNFATEIYQLPKKQFQQNSTQIKQKSKNKDVSGVHETYVAKKILTRASNLGLYSGVTVSTYFGILISVQKKLIYTAEVRKLKCKTLQKEIGYIIR